ncbi:MAG: hypothetical protein GY810_16470 [Aureispira sp.]|nr:hypothetical protein [Aureispira sp.]
MAQNRLKSAETPKRKPRAKKKKRAPLFGSLNISAFYLFKNIHFIFYLAFLGVIYIANSHYAIQTIKEIKIIQKDLKKISWESNSKKSHLMRLSMQSKVADKVHHLGLRNLKTKPEKVVTDD